ncbi:MAG: sulfite exporter TauE/SafE family protein [Oligoflexia bacterium]|nr:sulfite exporter TauE/SafE family protein [Oligoflexia bacterium]
MSLEFADYCFVTLGFLIVAMIYSSIGHAGASGYTAILVLTSFQPESLRPVSLFLNVVVGIFTFVRFYRAGLVDFGKVSPFMLGSLPTVYFAASLPIDRRLFFPLLGAILLCSSANLLITSKFEGNQQIQVRGVSWPIATLFGCIIGFLSVMTGTGGAIFLTPLVVHLKWATPRESAGMSSVFVLLNSVFGLLGNPQQILEIPSKTLLPWVFAVMVGALIGSYLGIRRLSTPTLKQIMSLVLLIAGIKLIYMALK